MREKDLLHTLELSASDLSLMVGEEHGLLGCLTSVMFWLDL